MTGFIWPRILAGCCEHSNESSHSTLVAYFQANSFYPRRVLFHGVRAVYGNFVRLNLFFLKKSERNRGVPVQGIMKFDSSKEDWQHIIPSGVHFKYFIQKNYKQPDILFYVPNYIPEYLGPNC